MQREIYAFFGSTRSVTHLAWSPFHDGIGSPFWPGEPRAIIGSWANLSTSRGLWVRDCAQSGQLRQGQTI